MSVVAMEAALAGWLPWAASLSRLARLECFFFGSGCHGVLWPVVVLHGLHGRHHVLGTNRLLVAFWAAWMSSLACGVQRPDAVCSGVRKKYGPLNPAPYRIGH